MKQVLLLCILIGTLLKGSFCRTLSSYEKVIHKAIETQGNEHGLRKIGTVHLVEKSEFQCPSPDGVFPADDQCTGDYYLCVDGNSYIQHCPGNFIYDVATQRCMSASESSCVPGRTTTSTLRTTTRGNEESTTSTQQQSTTTTQQDRTSTTSSTTSTTTRTTTPSGGIFICPSPNGNFPIPDTCGSDYYVCIAGFPYIATCPNGGIFDPNINACVPSNEASCNGPFVCPQADGFFPIPGACSSSYYVCIAGNPYVTTCPDEGIFDPVLHCCVPLNEASCYSPFVCPSDDGFFPIPGTCSGSYYVCIDGSPFIMNCPEDLIFDPSIKECLPQGNVTCNP